MANDGYVTLLHEVATRTLPLSRLEPVIGQERYDRLISAGDRLKNRLGQRTVWNINSTAVGGGVAEMLQVIVGYVAGFGIPVRWLTIGASLRGCTTRSTVRPRGRPWSAARTRATTSRSLRPTRRNC